MIIATRAKSKLTITLASIGQRIVRILWVPIVVSCSASQCRYLLMETEWLLQLLVVPLPVTYESTTM